MLSNEGSRQSDRIREGQSAPVLKESVIKESVEGQKKSLIMDVMEARLSRLQNYKLALDTKLFKEKEYTSRVKEIQEFLKKIATTNDPKAIEAASFHLSLDDGQLIRDQLLPQWNKGVIDIQKVALTLMRADNGIEQVEKIAATSLGDLFSQGVTKLNTDAKAKSDIVRRANKHFGEMMSQGALDNATPEQQNAARAGLEAMYQMRYISKEYIGETGGIAVPAGLQVVWGNYRDSMDIKNEWFNWSDTGKTQIASFLLYDLAPMIISGGVAGAVGKGAISIASRMPAIVNYANSGTKIAKVVSVGARAGLAVTEAAAFDLTFEGLRNQRLLIDKPHWQQDLIKNSFGFGFSRYLAGATKFAGIPLDPLSNQLIKQGLIVPAIITGVGVGQKLMANDPDAYNGAWEEFLLGAIMTGAFHMTGKVLESKYPAKETGIQKLEISTDGKKVDITTKDGQKFTTKMTDKLKSLWLKGNETKSNPRKPTPDITDVEAKASKTDAPAQKTADTQSALRDTNPKIPKLGNFLDNLDKYPHGTRATMRLPDGIYSIEFTGSNKVKILERPANNSRLEVGKEYIMTGGSSSASINFQTLKPVATSGMKENIEIRNFGEGDIVDIKRPDQSKPTDAPATPATASKDAPLQLEWNGKTNEKITLSKDPMAVLEARRAELIQWKKENPGNVRHDADLMRTETEIKKIQEKTMESHNSLTPEFFRGIRELAGKPHKEFIESINIALNHGEFPLFPGKDGTIWSIRKIEAGPNREKVTVGKQGSDQVEIITAKELKDTINGNIKKFANWEKANGKSEPIPEVVKLKKNQLTDIFFEGQVLHNNQQRFVDKIRANLKTGTSLEFPGPDGFIWDVRNAGKGTDPVLSVGKKGNKTEFSVPASELRKSINDTIKAHRKELAGKDNKQDAPTINQDLNSLKKEGDTMPTSNEKNTIDVNTTSSKTPAEGEKGTVKANDVTGKQSTSSHSDTTDLGAQARIDAEHGIGRKGLTQADLLEGGSFRSEMDAMMKMDDATFLSGVDRSPGLLYGKEMYDAAAKVRKMSDAEVLSAAIKGPNGTLILDRNGRHPKDLNTTITQLEKNLDADRVSLQSLKNNGLDHADVQAKVTAGENLLNKLESELLSSKASIVAENAALRSRLSGIINKKAPGLADAIIAKDTNKTTELLKRYWPYALLAAAILIALATCNGGKGTADSSTPEALAADLCGTDSGKKKGDIIDGRKSDAGATLTEKRRESISQKWMQTPKWKALVVEFLKNEDLLKGSRFADAFNAMLRNPTVPAVQHIQRWVGMEGVDNKQNQDGILGAITTDAISKFIEKCQTTKSVPSLVDQIPKPAPRATPAPVAPVKPDVDPASPLDPNNPHQQIV